MGRTARTCSQCVQFLSQHPGSELAILTFAGKDATAEFDMIHPPDVVKSTLPTQSSVHLR